MAKRWPPTLGVIGFDGGTKPAIALATKRRPLRADEEEGQLGPFPTGACCLTDGSCEILTRAACISEEGDYQGDGVPCEDVDCTHTGACCLDNECSIETESDCTDIGGTYQGDGTSCDPNPCEIPCVGDCCPDSCTTGFAAFDGSGRLFLNYSRSITGNWTRHTYSECPGSEFDETIEANASATLEQHYNSSCELITDVDSRTSDSSGGSGGPCSLADSLGCFCNVPSPPDDNICTSFFNACSCSGGECGSDTTDSTATTRTRTVVFCQNCQNDLYCIDHEAHPAFCDLEGSYTVIETLSNECTPTGFSPPP